MRSYAITVATIADISIACRPRFAPLDVRRGDLKDPESVAARLQTASGSSIWSALIAIPYSYENPLDVVQTNVLGTAHILDACRASQTIERVVLTSTSEVYGTARVVPITEEHPLQGQSPYAASKIGADALRAELSPRLWPARRDSSPVQYVWAEAIRPRDHSDDYQPSARSLAGEARKPLAPPRPHVCGRHGTWISLPCACEGAIGRVVNIGRGSDLTIGELVERIGARLGKPITVETDAQRVRPAASEVERLLAGTALAESLWGWKPRFSLDEGLDRTIAWVRDNLDLFRVDQYTT